MKIFFILVFLIINLKSFSHADEFNFEIFPNPAKDFLIFKFSEANLLNFEYKIYDSFGKLVYKNDLENIYSNTYKVNLDLSKGVYFLLVDDEIKKLFIE